MRNIKAVCFTLGAVAIAGLAALMFRYEYHSSLSIRVDRFTGSVEFPCDEGWATSGMCKPIRSQQAAIEPPRQIAAAQQAPELSKRKSVAEDAAEVADKLRCKYLLEKKAKGEKFWLEDDESVHISSRELFLPQWCVALLKEPAPK